MYTMFSGVPSEGVKYALLQPLAVEPVKAFCGERYRSAVKFEGEKLRLGSVAGGYVVPCLDMDKSEVASLNEAERGREGTMSGGYDWLTNCVGVEPYPACTSVV